MTEPKQARRTAIHHLVPLVFLFAGMGLLYWGTTVAAMFGLPGAVVLVVLCVIVNIPIRRWLTVVFLPLLAVAGLTMGCGTGVIESCGWGLPGPTAAEEAALWFRS